MEAHAEHSSSELFVEELPAGVAARVGGRLAAGETVRMQVAADMAHEQRYGEQWLVVTQQRVLVVPAGEDRAVEELALDQVGEVRTQELVGGGRLAVEAKEGAGQISICYSNTLTAKFAEVADGIRQLSKGEELTLPTQMERSRCERCERLLPEKDGICPFCISKWDTIRRIAAFLAPYRKRVMVFVAVSMAMTGMELVPPLLVKYIIDDVLIPKAGVGLLMWFVAGLAGSRLLFWGLDLTDGLLRADLSAWTARDVRTKLYHSLQFLPLRFHDKRKVGNLMSRFMNDSDRLEMFLLFALPFVLNNSLMLVGILGLLFYMNWELTLYVLVPIPFIVLGGLRKWDSLRRLWNKYHVKWSRFTTHLNESISGIRVVKSFAQERREEDRFNKGNDELREAVVVAERTWFIFYAILNFIMSFGIFLVWYFGGRQILNNELTLGVLMAFISYIWQLYRPLQFFSNFNNFLTRAFAGAERIFEVIDAQPESFEDPDAIPMPDLKGRVTFAKVDFGYDPGKPVLKGIDFEVEPGEMIGLVGKSGAGKSTVINLICRFYDVDRGELAIDGQDIRKIKLEDLRSQIGMVAQESFLFNGSIAENISYGKHGSSFDEIVQAARTANAHEFIVTKPDGYDTLVGERGNKLSGGEKQRISIARAILNDPKILILDEATSSVDTPTEMKLQEAIGRLVSGRTTFAIAHRLSTLRSADRLVVMDEGKIVEVGTHQELMEREGVFYKLVKTQQETSSVMAVGGASENASGPQR
jgi:ATP-binding cassette subfamily B protein